ncbi:MAG: signal recognition particle protein [Planctomycetota bacterium]
MFDSLAKRFAGIFSGLGSGKLTERNIEDGIKEVRQALLEADVALDVVKGFIERVRAKAVGLTTLQGVRPADQFVKVVKDEMVALLGGDPARIRWSNRGPTVIMMVGLQGTGKTTTTGKIARFLRKRESKKPLLVAADVQRPAAIEQLRVLGKQLDIPVYAEEAGRPPKICRRGIERAVELGCDVVLLDTAGRLHIDDELMDELEDIRDGVKPHEIWLVVDSMLGQDAVTSAREFNDRLDVSGVILTKTDGDARGGAALAVREVTGKPIRYVGTGEKLDQLEAFVPDRMAQRILGMGDVIGLVEQAQDVVDQKEAAEAAERLFMNRFTLEDVASQLQMMQKMGSMKDMLKKIPGAAQLDEAQLQQLPKDQEIKRMIAVIQSMTPAERDDPKLLHMQRRHRVARGSGTSVKTVGEVVNMHRQMQRQVKDLKKQGFAGKLAARKIEKDKKRRWKDKKKSDGGDEFGGWFAPKKA